MRTSIELSSLVFALLMVLVTVGDLAGQGRYDDWSRTEGDKYFMKYRATVYNPDGSQAKDCEVRGYVRERGELDVKCDNDVFELEAECLPGWSRGVFVMAVSPDGKRIGYQRIGVEQARHFAARGLRIDLEPTRPFRIQVVNDTQPVAGANVRLEVSFGPDVKGETDSEGWFETRVPLSGEVHRVTARSNHKMIGGYSFRRRPKRDQSKAEHQVEVYPCKNQLVRVVDEEGQPIAGLTVELDVSNPTPLGNFIDRQDLNFFETNNEGEFEDSWFPVGEKVGQRIQFPDQPWVLKGDAEFKAGVLVLTAEKADSLDRKLVTGKLKISSKMLGGFWVELATFQHPQENRMDKVWARTDDEGNFSARLMQGSTYCVFVNDLDWTSDYWTGIAVDSETGEISSPNIKLSKGPKVEVVLTEGPDHSPIENGPINLGAEFTFTWIENGEERSGCLGPDKWIYTNEKGVAVTRMPVGEVDFHVRVKDWGPQRTVKVKSQEVTRVEFHREFPGKRSVSGKLLPPVEGEVDFDGAEVFLFAIDNESSADAFAIANAEGEFQCEIAGGRFSVFARTKDGKYSAAAIAEDPDDGIEMTIGPTVSYQGKLVDVAGDPIANTEVGVDFELRNMNRPDGQFLLPYRLLVGNVNSETDEDGNFEFNGVPLDIFITLTVGSGRRPKKAKTFKYESVDEALESDRVALDR